MNKSPNRQFDASVLAVLHRTGRVWRGVVARMPNGRGSGKPRVLAHREFSAAESSRIAGWLDEHDAGRVAVVLHASSVICRTCQLPDAPADQLGPALQLQAEAHLFGIAPAHRTAMAVLEASPGETSRSGLVLAWPERRSGHGDSPDAHRPPLSEEQLAGREVRYVPDIASLASLLDGQRPTQPLAWVDREDGSLGLAVTHAGGAVFRGLREDAANAESWKASVSRVLAETCLSVGHTGAFVNSLTSMMQEHIADLGEGDARMIAPKEIFENAAARLEGAPTDDSWWSSYGIAAGVVLARASELAPLTELRDSVPVKSATPLDRAVAALSTRKAAVSAIVACVAVLMFGSLIVNGARLQVLKWKYPQESLDAQLADVGSIRNQLVMYRELDRSSWSSTKILSDIVSNTPQGIELEHIRISQMKSFQVRGRAVPREPHSGPELISIMRQQLNDSGIFRDAALDWSDPDAYGNYQFSLSANIGQPYRRHQYPEELDFGQKTLAERLYGPRAAPQRPTAEVTVEETVDEVAEVTGIISEIVSSRPRSGDEEIEGLRVEAGEAGEEIGEETGAVSRPRPTLRGTGPGGRSDALSPDQRREGSAISPDADIPPPLTREQIQAMSDSEVMDVLARVATARQRARTRQDDELHQRLTQEFEWLMDRRRNPR